MKHVNVPAQITTVEDKIAGNLTVNQILLLASPIFLDFAFYAVLPRGMHLNLYKLCAMAVVTGIFCLSAVRIRGKILLIWAITLTKYNLGPRYFVFNKNEKHLRVSHAEPFLMEPINANSSLEPKSNKPNTVLGISEEDTLRLSNFLDNPNLKLSFLSHKKGNLRVYISEVE
jgi:hypothetical protein